MTSKKASRSPKAISFDSTTTTKIARTTKAVTTSTTNAKTNNPKTNIRK